MRKFVDSEFQYSETYSQFKFKLDSGVPVAMLNQFYDVWINSMCVK